MLLAKALHIESLSEWQACLKLCGILPDKTVRVSGMGEDARWRKRCLELGRVPRHRCQRPLEDVEDQLREVVQLVEAGVTWAEQDTHPWELFIRRLHEMFLRALKARKQQEDESGLMFPAQFRKEPRNTYPWHQIQLPQTKRRATPVPVLRPLPREWRWGPDLLPVVLSWLSELQWLDLPPADERHPRAHWQVSFMELAIDFEAYAGRQLPPAPQSRFQGGDMSLQEKARVMRLITTLLGRSVGKESTLPAKLTNSCKSLIPIGAGAVMGLEGRPLLTKPLDVWKHLQRLRKYGEERWAQRRRQRQAKHRAKREKKQARSSE